VIAPSDKVVEQVAQYATTRHPVALLLRVQARNCWGAARILKATSIPSWLNAPNSAIRVDSDADGELFVYPQVEVTAALPIFERIFGALPDREDRFDAVGVIQNRAFDAWLTVDRSAEDRVAVHIAKKIVGYLSDEDVHLMRRSPDHLLPDAGEAIAHQAMLIGTTANEAQLALWVPFPTDLN
jgi:hypothetical protein